MGTNKQPPPPRKKRVHRRDSFAKPKSAANAKPPAVIVKHGGKAALRAKRFDRRTTLYKTKRRVELALLNHIGGADNATLPQAQLCDDASRLYVLSEIAWTEIMQNGVFDDDGNVKQAVGAYTNMTREVRELLKLLGLERKEKDITLQDILEGNTDEQ